MFIRQAVRNGIPLIVLAVAGCRDVQRGDVGTDTARPSAVRTPAPAAVVPASTDTTQQAGGKVALGYQRIASHGMTLDVSTGAVMDSEPAIEPPESVALRIRNFSDCRFSCDMNLSVRPLPADTTFDIWVHKLILPRSSAPDADDVGPSILDSAVVRGAPIYLLEAYCGDCTARALYTLRDRQIVILRWSIDDRELPQAEAQLLAVAHSLRRSPAASP